MKIAVWHNLPSGGGKRALHYHIRGLVERGHVVEVWRPPGADETYLPLQSLCPEHVVPLATPVPQVQNPVTRIMSRYKKVTDEIDALDAHCKECARQMTQGNFKLLFAGSSIILATAPIARYVKIPSVIYLGEPNRKLYELMSGLPWRALPPITGSWLSPRNLKNFLIDSFDVQGFRVQAREELQNASAFDTILVNSLFSRESVLRAYGLDSKVCYLGVDTDLFRYKNLDRADFVVGLGALIPAKNVEFIIRAIGKIPSPRPRLVWIGNIALPGFLDDLKELAKNLSVSFEPKVRVSDNELVDILNRAAAMVYAPRLEPFGLAPLEANACGTPVIAVAEGGVRETIMDGVNGLLVEYSPDTVAAAVQRLLSDKAYARHLGEKASGMVLEQWSLSASIDRLETRFREVLANRDITV